MTIGKTLLAAGAFAALAAAPVAAQNAWGSEVGIKGGLSFGNISNKGVLPGSLETRTGFAGGLYFGYSAPVVGIGFEALYAQRGLRSDESIAVAETKLDYIDIPAYLKINIPTSGIRPFVYAGPQISFEVRCRTGAGADCDDTSPRKSTDYAAVIGAGLRLGRGTGISLEGRYVYGLQDLKLSTLTSSESYKLRTFMLLVGIGK
ncbi:MAG TPA: porin family protein [Gemmatimonadales bacterium]|nr:porin family protein [Gemmatimonadales bacterium]